MGKVRVGMVAVVAAAAMTATGAGAASAAGTAPGTGASASAAGGSKVKPTPRPKPTMGRDNRPGKAAQAQASLRKAAVAAYVRGEARLESKGGSQVLAYKAPGAARTTYVQYTGVRTAKVWTLLAEFAGAGPRHNTIPQPAATDNSTLWVKNFDKAHYQRMFSTEPGRNFTDYYKKQSGGKLTTEHTVEDWVVLPKPESYYGENYGEGPGMDARPDHMVRDAVTAWGKAKRAAGWTDAQISAYMAKLDIWDRADQDGDGNFNEPDGYVDHVQIVHAGLGEEVGGGAHGTGAIWSHRGTAYLAGGGPARFAKAGGARVPGSDVWVSDYTTEAENGALGLFVHEFGHDLGLSDYYSMEGRPVPTASWTVMSTGSWLSGGPASAGTQDKPVGIGTNPPNLGGHEKLLLGWSQVMRQRWYPGTTVTTKLGSASRLTPGANQAVVVALPRAAGAYGGRYFLLENRTYTDYDANLRTGPWVWAGAGDQRIGSYPYNPGMLVWYIDDNYGFNEGDGRGFALVVDANQPTWNASKDLVWKDNLGNQSWADGDLQFSDATFTAPGTTLAPLKLSIDYGPEYSTRLTVPARKGASTFVDSSTTAYYKPRTDLAYGSADWGVRTPHSGLSASVLSADAAGTLTVRLTVPKAFTGQWK